MEDWRMTTYADVNAAWSYPLPAITREEAMRAYQKLAAHYKEPAYRRQPRRCWISLQPTRNLNRGWARLVHDVSHIWHSRRMPNFQDHGGAHAAFELEVVRYVLAKGWLDGRLRPRKMPRKPAKARPTSDQRLTQVLEAKARWEARRRRAEAALARLARRERGLRLALARKAVSPAA
jgi:hypothetical protein